MSATSRLKTLLLGRSLPTSAHAEERLNRAEALAVLSSDALSSVAYATEETLMVLVTAGAGATQFSLPIAFMIVVLLILVILSYRQTIRAYPLGGGSYIVARQNLGIYPGLVAASSLMIDYILTVTVSISAGTAALTSAFPSLHPISVPLCLVFIFLLMLANLRGVKESGRIFMIPTYTFVVGILVLIGIGLFRQATGQVPLPSPLETTQATESLSLFLVLKAFSAGCTALTGVEAISDGVTAFKPPESQNARATLIYMGVLLGCMFLGISYLSHHYQIVPSATETVLSQLSRQIFGQNVLYYLLQIATLLILILAANTSFADFPRLCYFLARDGFLPRQLALLGDRLVYTNGIIVLSLLAAFLVVIFKGETSAVIPLYAVGVFNSFTLSQAGMVKKWLHDKTPGWQASALMNAVGALATAVVLVVIILTKFMAGAWLVLVAIPLVVVIFFGIHRHYQFVASRLSVDGIEPRVSTARASDGTTHPAIVVVGNLNRGTLEALDYARTIADKVVAIHVDIGSTDRDKLREQMQRHEPGVELIILESPYRSVISPIVEFVKEFEQNHPEVYSTVIVPRFVTQHWWEGLLHNQTALFLRAELRANRSRVFTTVRYYL